MGNIKSEPISPGIFILLSLLIFARPFLSGLTYPLIETYYQGLAIALAIITFLLYRKAVPKNPYFLPVLLLFISYIASSAYSVNVLSSLKETIKFMSFVSIFFVVSMAGGNQKKTLIKIAVAGAFLISLYSIYQYFWGYGATLAYLKKINSDFLMHSSYARDILILKRAIGTFPSPTIFGGYLVINFFLSLQLLSGHGLKKPPALWFISLAAISAALILTKSMGAWLSLLSALTVLLIASYKAIGQKGKKLMLFSFIFIAFVLIFILASRWSRLTNLENPQNSITQRINYWRTAIEIIKKTPFIRSRPREFSGGIFRIQAIAGHKHKIRP